MEINKENYGRFVIDYYDGHLSQEDVRRLMLFLDENKDCKKEFDDFEEVGLEKTPVNFPEKDRLKKVNIYAVGELNEENYEAYFVMDHDKELSRLEQKSVLSFLQKNVHLQAEYDLFSRLQLQPDAMLLYGDKSGLKRHAVIPLFRNFAVAVAAVLLLLVAVRFLMPTQKMVVHPMIAQIKPMLSLTNQSILLTSHRHQTALLMPKSSSVVPNEIVKTENLKLLPLQLMASLSAPVYLKKSLPYVDLLFPKGNDVHESVTIMQPIVVEGTKRRSFFNKILIKPYTTVERMLAMDKETRRNKRNGEKGLVKFIDKGVTAINTLTDSDKLIMVKTFDQQGNLLAFQVVSGRFNFQKKMKPFSAGE